MERIRHGGAGKDWHGSARTGSAAQARFGESGRGRSWQAWRGAVRHGSEAHGRHGQDGFPWQGEALQAR